VFVVVCDNGRDGMRRWCDIKACGNRAKVRRFRRNLSRAELKSIRFTHEESEIAYRALQGSGR